MAAGDSGASLTARSERGAAGAALGGRGERAEKADSGAPQPHIEGTFLYVIARCAPGSAASGDVARRAARGRGHVTATPGRAAGIRGLGWDTMPCSLGWGLPGQGGTRGQGTASRVSHLSGVALGQLHPPPASPRSSSPHPFLGKKMSAELVACCPAPQNLRDYGDSAGLASRGPGIWPTAVHGPHRVCDCEGRGVSRALWSLLWVPGVKASGGLSCFGLQ